MSKTDLIKDEEALAKINRVIKDKARENTKIVPVQNGRVESEILLGIGASAEDDLDNRHSIHEKHHEHGHHHHHNDDIVTLVREENQTANIKDLVKVLTALVKAHEIYRIKGFVNIPDKPMRMVLQGVGARFDYYFDR